MNITDGKTETRGALCKMVEREISAHTVAKNSNFTTHSFCKESEELDLIQQACTITEKGFRRVLSFGNPM
jgi:Xaa-Pro aminopeptidase